MSANQLMTKALSTTSEDEAIACLKMARKKGLKIEGSTSVTNGEAEEWAQLVVQARTERDQYHRMWKNELDRSKQLQKDLDHAAFLIGVIPIAAIVLISLFLLIFILL